MKKADRNILIFIVAFDAIAQLIIIALLIAIVNYLTK